MSLFSERKWVLWEIALPSLEIIKRSSWLLGMFEVKSQLLLKSLLCRVLLCRLVLKKKRDKKSFEVDLLHFVLSLLPISFRKPQRAVYLFKEWRLNRPLEG